MTPALGAVFLVTTASGEREKSHALETPSSFSWRVHPIPADRQRTRLAFGHQLARSKRPQRQTKSNELPGRSASFSLNASPSRPGASKSSGALRWPAERQRRRNGERDEARLPLQFRDLQPRCLRPHAAWMGAWGVEIILRRRSVGLVHAMAINEPAVDHPAVARDEQSNVGPPSVPRAPNALRPHRRMRRRANFAKKMWPASAGIECRLCFPVEPSDVVLLRRQ